MTAGPTTTTSLPSELIHDVLEALRKGTDINQQILERLVRLETQMISIQSQLTAASDHERRIARLETTAQQKEVEAQRARDNLKHWQIIAATLGGGIVVYVVSQFLPHLVK